MSRILLTYLLPLVLPTAIYVAWVWYARATHQGDGELPGLRKGPMFWCLLAGFALMVAGLVTVAMLTGAPPGSTYEPPRYEGGKVVPPGYKK
jgi:hypothetical protein